jgi:type I restriction enzyme, S subunit
MNSIKPVRLSEVVTEALPGFACGAEDPDGVLQIRMNNILRDGNLDLSKKRRVPSDIKAISRTLLRPGDVLFNATNSPDLVGKTALVKELSEPTVYSNHFFRLRTDDRRLSPAYLARWLSWQFGRGVFKGLVRQWVNQATVGRQELLSLSIPLLPLGEQRRITTLLDQASALLAKRRQSIALLGELGLSIFLDMFGHSVSNDLGWSDSQTLGEVASIVSGITKGRKAEGPFERVPYLAVANVQDMRLDLSAVKVIDATAAEISKYRLKRNDLLLTEGGDPDKLGRGTLWQEELPLAIHQNHIFRVRLHEDAKIHPVFLNWLVASERGRRFFLRSAKQTTGIASINATQLKKFPLLVPPLDLQRVYAERLAKLETQKVLQRTQLVAFDALFAAFQQRAFQGNL